MHVRKFIESAREQGYSDTFITEQLLLFFSGVRDDLCMILLDATCRCPKDS